MSDDQWIFDRSYSQFWQQPDDFQFDPLTSTYTMRLEATPDVVMRIIGLGTLEMYNQMLERIESRIELMKQQLSDSVEEGSYESAHETLDDLEFEEETYLEVVQKIDEMMDAFQKLGWLS